MIQGETLQIKRAAVFGQAVTWTTVFGVMLNLARDFKSASRFVLVRFEISGAITPLIVFHSVQLLLLIVRKSIFLVKS